MDVVGPGTGVVEGGGFALPFRLAGWDCSTYSNLRESRVSVTGPYVKRVHPGKSHYTGGPHLVCEADVHHCAEFSVCELLRCVGWLIE